MKLRTPLSLGLAAALLLGGAAMAGSTKRPVIVELYTSQGCNSCPPADELLGRLADRPNVIAMSLPVTYWDMLGWKDTLATDTNTKRQKAYAQYMGRGGVYTPQIIVDGVSDVVGSREGDVESAIARREAEIEVSVSRLEAQMAAREAAAEARQAALEANLAREEARAEADEARSEAEEVRAELVAEHRNEIAAARQAAAEAHAELVAAQQAAHAEQVAARQALREHGHDVSALAIPVTVSESNGAMHITVASATDRSEHNATIWLFHLRNAVTVNIASGENEGRTMTYRNVVADLRPVGHWDGNQVSLDLPKAQMSGLPHDALAVVVQQAGYGRVVGASMLDHPDFQALH
jgi:hypothetical protein